MLPGAVAVVVAVPEQALVVMVRARRAGWEVRDTMSIHTVDGLLLAPMLRKPFQGTLTGNVLANGTGVLNIEACRVGYRSVLDEASATPEGRATSRPGGFASRSAGPDGRFEYRPEPASGRWPTDVVFIHGLGCGVVSGCVEGCPVAELDRQSGVLKSEANPTHRRSVSKSVAMAGAQQPSVQIVRRGAEQSGASRFYPCFTDVDEFRGWLQQLLGRLRSLADAS